jgi:putative membrane protein (TIGR04086 family)
LRTGLKLKARDAKENPAKVLAVVLFIMFIISGLLLLLLALLLYRLELSEAVVKVAVIIIYIVTGMSGGILMGKKIKDKKFLWGFLAGTVYFGILLVVSLAVKGGTGIEPVKMVTTWVLCACAGTAGGMIS